MRDRSGDRLPKKRQSFAAVLLQVPHGGARSAAMGRSLFYPMNPRLGTEKLSRYGKMSPRSPFSMPIHEAKVAPY